MEDSDARIQKLILESIHLAKASDIYGACSLLRSVIQQSPGNPAATSALIACLLRYEHNEPSAEEVIDLVANCTDDLSDLCVSVGRLFISRGDPKRGTSLLEKVAPEHPEFPSIKVEHITALIDCMRLDEATLELSNYREILDPIRYFSLSARANERKGNFEVAQKDLRAALAIAPEDIALHAAMGRAYLALHNLEDAMVAFQRSSEVYWSKIAEAAQLQSIQNAKNPAKRQHDLELKQYLALADRKAREEPCVCDQADLPQSVAKDDGLPLTKSHIPRLRSDEADSFDRYWLTNDAVRPSIIWDSAIELVKGQGFAVIDNFLTTGALNTLRKHLVESNIWRGDYYENGYLITTLESGLAHPALLRAMDQIRCHIAPLIGGQALASGWAFKLSENGAGVGPHADFSDVTVNLWLSRDLPYEDPESGGLQFWNVKVAQGENFRDYNASNQWIERKIRFATKKWRVGHRANRAVVFRSRLIHASDVVQNKRSFPDRRINISLAYGY